MNSPLKEQSENSELFALNRELSEKNKQLIIAQEELQEVNQKLEDAQKLAGVGYWKWNIKTGDVSWSKEVYGIFQLDPQEFTPQIDSIQELSPWPEDHLRDKELIAKAISNHEKGEYDQRYLLPDGSTGYYHSTFQGKYSKTGELEFIEGTVMDITARKRAEQKIRESEAKFKSYVEFAPDGILVLDENGVLIDTNRAACRITGYQEEQLIGMQIDNLIFSEDILLIQKELQDVKETGFASSETRFAKKDGGIGHWIIEFTKIADHKYLVYAKDITEQKKLELQLRQAEKMQALGQLAGGVAHDFNNQLTGIIGYTQILKSNLKDEKLTQYLDKIVKAAERSSELISQLLAFSHKGKYITKAINMHDLLDDVIHLLKHSFDKKINIVNKYSANTATIMGDSTQLQNAILNLAINARDAMPDGGTITIETAVRQLDDEHCQANNFNITPGNFLQIKMKDTGLGISKENMNTIFEPFFTTKERGKGTGMGLAAVFGTIVNHKGMIEADSEPGIQTTFTIYLPLAQDEHSVVEPEHKPYRNKSNTKSLNVMVIDDEPYIHEILSAILEEQGYGVTTFMSCKDCIDYYRDNWQDIDLVILDMIMPEMSGKELFGMLREINPEISVLISSGYSVDGDAQTIIDQGAKGFIQKPFTREALITKIHDIVRE